MSPPTLHRLMQRMQPVRLHPRDVLNEAFGEIETVYFPLGGLSTLLIRFEDGFQAEVGLVGREGMVGTSAVSGASRARVDAVVQIEGEALRIGAGDLRREMERSPEDRKRLRRYGERLWAQSMQLAACNGHHSLEQRLARWLLMVQDRVGGRELAMTQEMLASMLCVHRPSVTVAAGRLQRMGSIRYSGGRVTIVDRASLERSSCECYAAVQQRILIG